MRPVPKSLCRLCSEVCLSCLVEVKRPSFFSFRSRISEHGSWSMLESATVLMTRCCSHEGVEAKGAVFCFLRREKVNKIWTFFIYIYIYVYTRGRASDLGTTVWQTRSQHRSGEVDEWLRVASLTRRNSGGFGGGLRGSWPPSPSPRPLVTSGERRPRVLGAPAEGGSRRRSRCSDARFIG